MRGDMAWTAAIPDEVVELVVRAAGGHLWSALTCRSFRRAVRRASPALSTGAADVVASVGRMAWARSIGCPFDDDTLARVAAENCRICVLATLTPTPADARVHLVCAAAAQARRRL